MSCLLLDAPSIPFHQLNAKKRLESFRDIIKASSERFVLFVPTGVLGKNDPLRAIFAEVVEFDDYYTNGMVEIKAVDLHRIYQFKGIVTFKEYDILRVARIRERLGIPGQDVASALAYRDKLVMKEVARRNGIPTIPFREIQNAMDLLDFARDNGFPFIVKPRLEIGFAVIRGREELEAFAAKELNSFGKDHKPNLLAEQYSGARMAHVDGIWKDGGFLMVAVSLYTGPGPQHTHPPTQEEAAGSFMLHHQNPLFKRIEEFTRNMLSKFPTPASVTFHVEVWIDDQDGLCLNEGAVRTGGVYVPALLECAFGFNLERVYLMEVLGQKQPPVPKYPRQLAAVGRITQREGSFRDYPRQCPLAWVHLYDPAVKPGSPYLPPKNWYDSVAGFVVQADSEETLAGRTREFIEWFWSHSDFVRG